MQNQQLKEELANSLTHGLGVLFSIVGMPILVTLAVLKGTSIHIWGVSVFSFSFLMLYMFSTLYHSIQHPPVKRTLRILDHIGIYVLIAGSYTPFIFFFMNRPSGYIFLGILWGCAILGSILKIFFTGRFNLISTLIYLMMGWTVIFIAKPIFTAMSFDSILWIAIGGGAYTIGVVFYLWKNLKFHHAIWHIFVLTGSISHYIAVLYSVTSVSNQIGI